MKNNLDFYDRGGKRKFISDAPGKHFNSPFDVSKPSVFIVFLVISK